MKTFALLAVLALSSSAFAAPFRGLGPVRLTPTEVKANAIQSKLSSTMHTNPTQVEVAIKGNKWTASEMSTFNGTPTPGPSIERAFASGSIKKAGGSYNVTVSPIDR